MAKPSPFDYVKGINYKTYTYDLSGYNPYLTNRAFAGHVDTVMFAEAMNQAHALAPALQYDFYFYAVRKGKRFGFPPKPPEMEHLEIIQEHYGYSRQKATEALRLLSPSQIKSIVDSHDKGGYSK